MIRTSNVSVRKTLRKLLPPSVIELVARETGAFKRIRRISPVAFVWSLVFGCCSGRRRSLAGMRRIFNKLTRQGVEECSFYDRFTPSLVTLLHQLLDGVLQQSWGKGRAAQGRLAQFRDILVTDATICRLHRALAVTFRGVRTNHSPAALKAHLVLNVTGAGKQTVKLSAAREHDRRAFQLGPWVKGRLLLMDLGYFDYRLFARIAELGGCFISRLKAGTSGYIVDQHVEQSAGARPVIGRELSDVLGQIRRETLDVQIAVRVRRRTCRGRRRSETAFFRVVGIRDPGTGQYLCT